jgi:hypothetical protein
MRRRWKTLKSVLTGKKADETPCFAYDLHHPLGYPVTARIANGRICLACPVQEQAGRPHIADIPIPQVAAGRCRLLRDAEDNVSIWLGLAPGITVKGLQAIFKEEPCHTQLVSLARLAGHLDDLADEEDILADLKALCRRVEQIVREILKDRRCCLKFSGTELTAGILRTELRAGQLMRRMPEGRSCAFVPAKTGEAAPGCLQNAGAGCTR